MQARGTGRPVLPPGSIDTHFHVFGPAARYPYAEGRSYTPSDASVAEYAALARTLGIAAAVMVQPSVYGSDNSRMLDALADAPIPMRGIAVVEPDIDDAELDRMHDIGVRGIRINLVFAAGQGLQTAHALAPRLRDRGWHIQFLVDVSTIPGLYAEMADLGVPLVFDHMGHIAAPRALHDPGFADMVRLASEGLAWVKLTGAYRLSRATPDFADVAPLAHRLIEAAPDRVVWGTDWPHTALSVAIPDDAHMARMALDWVPDSVRRQRLFVTNAARLYGFDTNSPTGWDDRPK